MSFEKTVHWDSIPGSEDITRFELPNGITILTRPNFNSASVVLSGFLPGGSVFDTDEKLGLAHLTAQALMYGTETRSFHEIFDKLEASGASLGFGSVVHNVSLGGRALAEDLELLLDVLSDCLRKPIFPESQVLKLKVRMMAALSIRDQNTPDMASIKFDELLFAGHPYARPVDGYAHTVQTISTVDLENFYKQHYTPKGMVLVVVGAVSPQEVKNLVEKYFGDWVKDSNMQEAEYPPMRMRKGIQRAHFPLEGKQQTDLVMGCLGLKRDSEDFLTLSLGNNILGQFGMMGRIGEVVREQAGLAYFASSSLNSWVETGSWEVSAGVNPKNLEKAIVLIQQEMKRFVTDEVTEAEIEDSKANYIGRLPLSLESNNGVANALLRLERFQLGLDYFKHYPYLIAEISAGQILSAAQKYLDPENLVIVSSGPDLVQGE